MQLNLMLTYLGQPYIADGKECKHAGYSLYDARLQVDVKDVCSDSSRVTPGAMFVAIRGLTVDGHDFIPDAVGRGAIVVMSQKEVPVPDGVILVVVDNTREGLSAMAGAFYDFPAAKMVMVGITGTNGKTTTANLCASMLATAGHNVGIITTIDWRFNGQTHPSLMTTPDALELQRGLAQMYEAGVTHVVMEVSSHAIEQARIAHCFFDVAAFTNLSQDHLDFHGSMEAYGAVKKRLFADYLRRMPKRLNAAAVINVTHKFGRDLFDGVIGPKLSVAVDQAADVVLENLRTDLDGIKARLETPRGRLFLESPLIGAYNQENLVLAAGVGLALNLADDVIVEGLNTLAQVKGRLERVPAVSGFSVFVDYAHTPDALENVLKTLKGLKPRRLLCVFGCGGNRDRAKRPLMGGIAVKYSDVAFVTSDNPRNEEPPDIINDILTGISPAAQFVVEPDRAAAIKLAVQQAANGDIVLIAGKGHEDYQIIKGEKFHFDDVEQARIAMEEKI